MSVNFIPVSTRITVLFIAFAFWCALNSCASREKKGQRLAEKYCSSCHMFPDPGLLSKDVWEKNVLPEMAIRMAVEFPEPGQFSKDDLDALIFSIPKSAMVTKREWQLISDYYLDSAPYEVVTESLAHYDTLLPFHVEKFRLPGGREGTGTMLTKDPVEDVLYYATRDNFLHTFSSDMKILYEVPVNSPISAVLPGSDGLKLLTMGIMDPNDQALGQLLLRKDDGEIKILIDSLKRPVSFEVADLNNDGLDDYVICAFGHYTGALLAFEQTTSGSYKKHQLQQLPGSRKVIIRDFDNNGFPDILAMLTQGDERIVLLHNFGNFRFRITTLLRFPPVYGSSYFEIHDFNNDGKFDILYSNGDNGDYSMVLKPYHGVRIFLNDGTNRFNEHWFHPMPGASKVLARDFDRDGDLDIAAISFFPDFRQPESSFLYFENNNGEFIPKVTPQAASGRWLLMEAADLDSDGSTDLVLGSLNFPLMAPKELILQWNQDPVALLILKNK